MGAFRGSGALPEEHNQKGPHRKRQHRGPEPVTFDHAMDRRKPQPALGPFNLAELFRFAVLDVMEVAHDPIRIAKKAMRKMNMRRLSGGGGRGCWWGAQWAERFARQAQIAECDLPSGSGKGDQQDRSRARTILMSEKIP